MANQRPRYVLAALGLAPIGALCIALFGLVPLHVSARWLVLPALGLAIALGLAYPRWGKPALVSFDDSAPPGRASGLPRGSLLPE